MVEFASAILVLATGVVVAVIIALKWRRAGCARPAAESACARCAYPVAGLESFECPECGSDLRLVGISSAEMTRLGPAGLIMLVVVYVVLWGIGCVVLQNMLHSALRITTATTMSAITPWDSAPANWLTVQFDAAGSRWGPRWSVVGADTATIALTMKDGAKHSLAAHRTSAGWRMDAPAGSGGDSAIDAATLGAWLKAAGIDTGTEVGTDLLAYLLQQLDGAAADASISSTETVMFSLQSRGTSSLRSFWPRWVDVAVPGLWVVGTCVGAWMIISGTSIRRWVEGLASRGRPRAASRQQTSG